MAAGCLQLVAAWATPGTPPPWAAGTGSLRAEPRQHLQAAPWERAARAGRERRPRAPSRQQAAPQRRARQRQQAAGPLEQAVEQRGVPALAEAGVPAVLPQPQEPVAQEHSAGPARRCARSSSRRACKGSRAATMGVWAVAFPVPEQEDPAAAQGHAGNVEHAQPKRDSARATCAARVPAPLMAAGPVPQSPILGRGRTGRDAAARCRCCTWHAGMRPPSARLGGCWCRREELNL
jgi:hypothetical protein